MQRYELDAALKFYEKVCAALICRPQVLSQVCGSLVTHSGLFVQAVGLEPDNTDLLDAAGELCVEAGRSEDATKLFTRSIELKPNENSCKYMNLGMLAGECIRLASVSQLLVLKLSRFGLHSSIMNINIETPVQCFRYPKKSYA
jgi:tetratricopeptide (TPR) repeat protein